MKILLTDFNAKVGREDSFKPKIGNENLHEISNDQENQILTSSRMFPHRNIHKCSWTSPEGETHSQTAHIFIDERQHSNVADVGS
jgi:hypothetical protein